MKTVAFVPIKMHSSRLAHKNLLPLGDHSISWYVFDSLLHVKGIDEIYVYCSDEKIMNYIPDKITFQQRPEWLDGDSVKGFDIYQEFIKTVDADVYILAHTTSPFIKSSSIQNALDNVKSGSFDSAFSAQRIQTFTWYEGKPINYDLDNIPRTQDIEPVWAETSAFFIFKKEIFTDHQRRIGFKPYIQEVSGSEAIDIDEQKDYDMAVKLYEMEKLNI